MLEEVVIPTAKSQAGFKNGTWLHDGKGNGMGVIVFATAEDAESAQNALKPPPGGPAPELCRANFTRWEGRLSGPRSSKDRHCREARSPNGSPERRNVPPSGGRGSPKRP